MSLLLTLQPYHVHILSTLLCIFFILSIMHYHHLGRTLNANSSKMTTLEKRCILYLSKKSLDGFQEKPASQVLIRENDTISSLREQFVDISIPLNSHWFHLATSIGCLIKKGVVLLNESPIEVYISTLEY